MSAVCEPGQFDDAEEDSIQPELLAVTSRISDVTLQPPSDAPEEEQEEDEEEEEADEEEEWAWRSAGGDLTKRYNRTSLNCQVRTPLINNSDRCNQSVSQSISQSVTQTVNREET
ncbi:bone sialoprotein 2-like [Plectropomus leopardus]|uniref:bone sialoprotein 2-like n=1 Tax=Plectropomus leopardus TaxID=160734 RepID=UPI001C4C0A76|nr:bone sialoprotein 2-like [Plectropomus leopardus]